jgi:hypothetical protein
MNAPDTAVDWACWTRLGLRMGYTSNFAQRLEFLAAVERMTWIEIVAGTAPLAGPVARVMSHGRHCRHSQPSLVGLAELDGGRRLIGRDDGQGSRLFVLDLDAEAIVLLAQISRPLQKCGPAVASAAASRSAHQVARPASKA